MNKLFIKRRKLRSKFDLPPSIPRPDCKLTDVKICKGCVNNCQIIEGGIGFCGLRAVKTESSKC